MWYIIQFQILEVKMGALNHERVIAKPWNNGEAIRGIGPQRKYVVTCRTDMCAEGVDSPSPNSVLAGLLQLGSCSAGGFYLVIGASLPGLLLATNLALSLGISPQGLPCDVGYRLSQCLAYPAPFALCFYLHLVGVCFALYHRSSLETTSGHLMLGMFLRHLLANVFNFLTLVLVTRHVSAPYSGTDFTLVLKIPILFRTDMAVDR